MSGCLTHQGPCWSLLRQIEGDTKNAAVINGDEPKRFYKQVSVNFYPMCHLASSKQRGSREPDKSSRRAFREEKRAAKVKYVHVLKGKI